MLTAIICAIGVAVVGIVAAVGIRRLIDDQPILFPAFEPVPEEECCDLCFQPGRVRTRLRIDGQVMESSCAWTVFRKTWISRLHSR